VSRFLPPSLPQEHMFSLVLGTLQQYSKNLDLSAREMNGAVLEATFCDGVNGWQSCFSGFQTAHRLSMEHNNSFLWKPFVLNHLVY